MRSIVRLLTINLLLFNFFGFSQPEPYATSHYPGITKEYFETTCDLISPRWNGEFLEYCSDGYLVRELHYGLCGAEVLTILELNQDTVLFGTKLGLSLKRDTNWMNFNRRNSDLASDTILELHETINNRVFVRTHSGIQEFVENDFGPLVSGLDEALIESIEMFEANSIGDLFVLLKDSTISVLTGGLVVDVTTASDFPDGKIFDIEVFEDTLYVAGEFGLIQRNGIGWENVYTNFRSVRQFTFAAIDNFFYKEYTESPYGAERIFKVTEDTVIKVADYVTPRGNNQFSASKFGCAYVSNERIGVLENFSYRYSIDNFGDVGYCTHAGQSGKFYYGMDNGVRIYENGTWDSLRVWRMEDQQGYRSYQSSFAIGDKERVFIGGRKGLFEVGRGFGKLVYANELQLFNNSGVASVHNSRQFGTIIHRGFGAFKKLEDSIWVETQLEESGWPVISSEELSVGILNGLYIMRLGQWMFFDTSNSYLSSNEIHDVSIGPNQEIIISFVDAGIDVLDGTKWLHIDSSNSPIPDNNVQFAVKLDDGRLALAINQKGLFLFSDGDWIDYNLGNSPLRELTFTGLKEIEGKLYISTHDGTFILKGDDWEVLDSSTIPISNNKMLGFSCNGQKLYLVTENEVFESEEILGRERSTSISGLVYHDRNRNSIRDSGEEVLSSQMVRIAPLGLISTTDDFGRFDLRIDTGSYIIQVTPHPFWANSEDDKVIKVNAGLNDSIFLGIYPEDPFIDLNIFTQIQRTRCLTESDVVLRYQNNGNRIQDINVSLTLDSRQVFSTFQSDPDSTDYVNGVAYWHIENLEPFEHGFLRAKIRNPGTANIGDTLLMISSISDGIEYVFSDSLERILTCSYDPNDKQVEPIGLGEEHYTLLNERLQYTIRFQNTGNDTAYNVSLVDTLSSYLDLSTYQLIGSSHSVQGTLEANGKLLYNFKNIFLVDSLTDEENSHGFVTFEISPKSNLENSTLIENKARIYFDFNPPIITNTTWNLMVEQFPIAYLSGISSSLHPLGLFPNPAVHGVVRIGGDIDLQDFHSVEVYDLKGRDVGVFEITASNEIVFWGLESGTYQVVLISNDGTRWVESLLIESNYR